MYQYVLVYLFVLYYTEAALSWREPTGIRISIYQYELVCTSIHQYIPRPVLITSYQYVLACTSIYQYIQVHSSIYRYVLVCAVELWPWQATPGWSDCEGDWRAQGNCAKGPSQSFC